jgi:integrase
MARVKLTAGLISDFSCKPCKPGDPVQVFLWDSGAPGLAVRATAPGVRNPAGGKAYIFQGKLAGRDVRITIGDCQTWSLEEVRDRSGEIVQPGARQEARRLQSLLDQGKDPRLEKSDRIAAEAGRRTAAAAQVALERRMDVTIGEAWKTYCEARRKNWSARSLTDHEKAMHPGGAKKTRGRKRNESNLTVAGPLAALADLPLSELSPEAVAAWLKEEVAHRPTQADLAFRLLRGFVNWAAVQRVKVEESPADKPDYRPVYRVNPAACVRSAVKDDLPKRTAKDDCLQREQLKGWFAAVRRVPSPVIAAYLQIMLLTGARRNELTSLSWANVDFQWRSLRIGDKVEGERVIPMTPYVEALLRALKARSETPLKKKVRPLRGEEVAEEWKPSPWVFESRRAASGRLQEPRLHHVAACTAAGIEGLTIHGLRRSFGTLCEWVECPVGISAQIMGHKPSAIAEKHYRRRPLDLLRLWHTKIEKWILEQAEISQPAHKGEFKEVQPAA